MKQICSSRELYKALETAGLLQYVHNIEGSEQKQEDGIILPVCEIIFKLDVDDISKIAVNTVFAQQVARDWRAILSTEAARLAAIDADLKTDNIADQVKAMTKEEYNLWWDALTAAQKDRILKRMFRAFCKNR